MQKFRCEKCGHRIAIQSRHLGTLVTCPECGNLTHPLAEKIIERTPAPASVIPTLQVEPSRACENCGRAIGKLETPQLWDKSIVCPACYRALSDSSRPQKLIEHPGVYVEEPAAKALAISKKPRRGIVSRSQRKSTPVPAMPPRLTLRVPRGPLRLILWLIVIALAAWFVLNVVRFISVLVNVAIVGFLLLATLWVLYQSGMNDMAEGEQRDSDE